MYRCCIRQTDALLERGLRETTVVAIFGYRGDRLCDDETLRELLRDHTGNRSFR